MNQTVLVPLILSHHPVIYNTQRRWMSYGVATISRLLKNVGLFCKRDLQKRPMFSKETYTFKEPTNRSHPIVLIVCVGDEWGDEWDTSDFGDVSDSRHMCDVSPLVCHESCDMTHSYVWHDSFICVTWLIHLCDMTHSYVWHGSFICVAWLIHTCDESPPVRHESCHTYQRVMSHVSKSHVTHIDESCDTYEWVMSHIRIR